jgi:hypothetical protein
VESSSRIQVPISLQRIPFTIDPLSEAGRDVAHILLPRRTAAVSKLYLGLDRVRLHLQLVAGALSSRTLPAQLVGVLLQPDGSGGRLLQIQFDPASVGGTGPKLTAVTKDDGSFTIRLPQSVALPDSGLPLIVHGANGNAAVTIPAAQIAAANGVFGEVTLPNMLKPLHVSILNALTALVPAKPPAAAPAQQCPAPQLHVVKLGDDDACQLSFNANNGIDKFPYGIFFRLVEPQTSIPHVVLSVPAARGFYPIPQYASSSAPADGDVTYVDRIPVEQPLSVDGFRDQIMGVNPLGTVTADETVPMAGTLGLGYVLWMSQRWTFQGLGLGDLVYSLALAPGEQQQIAIFERVDTATVRESEFFTEEEVESQAALSDTSTQATFSSAFDETVNAGSKYSAQAKSRSTGWGVGGSIGIFSAGGSGSSGSTSSSGQTSQWLQGQRNTTQQAAENTHSAAENQAAARRSAAHTSMRMATASESEAVTTKVITNHNHTRALTLQYWEVLRLYDVTTAIDGISLICLVPMQVVRFLPPGHTLTLSDPKIVSDRSSVLKRYSSLIKHADVLARALPRQFRYGLTLLQQFAADPTTEVEPFGGLAEDVVQFTLTGTFVHCEDIYITAVTKRNTRIGPAKLWNPNPLTIPADTYSTRDQLLADLSQARQGCPPGTLNWGTPPISLRGSLALPASLNRSDIVRFEFTRNFRAVDYTLVAQEISTIQTLQSLFPTFKIDSFPFGESKMPRTTIHITPGELERVLHGPQLSTFTAMIQELDAEGKPAAKGETYANDSLNVELPPQPYPVPAIQVGPVLRFNQILEIEKMAQHVARNTVLYSKAVWASMSPDERAILLEHYTIGVPTDGISDASQMVPLLNCVENRVLGYFGNSMMMPFMIPQAVAEDMNIDPVQLQNALLAYQQEAFVGPQSTIALPTRGVLGEAVLGHCPSAEKIDLTRFWNWADSPADTAPAIAPVTLPTTTPSIVAGMTGPNTLTNLPPLINNVLTAPTPDTTLLQALSKAAASQKDFSPEFTGAKELAGLVKNAQDTANAARSDALHASTQLISQAMSTAASMISGQGSAPSLGGLEQQGGPQAATTPRARPSPNDIEKVPAGSTTADAGAGVGGAPLTSAGIGGSTANLPPPLSRQEGSYQLVDYKPVGTVGGIKSASTGPRFLGVEDENFLDKNYRQKMIATGWHLLRKEGEHEVWQDPHGDILWIHIHTQADDVPEPDEETDCPEVREARDKADWLESMRQAVMRDLIALEKLVGTSQYSQKYSELANEWNYFDTQLRGALRECADWEKEDICDSQMNLLVEQISRIKRVRDWVADQGSAQFWQRLGRLPAP